MIVSWDRQVLPEGDVITGFDVQYQVLGTIDWTDYPFDGMGLSATITGLASNTEFWVQVRAVNGEGSGPWSMTAKAMTRTAELTVAFGGSNYTVTEGETATITVTVTPVADRDVTVTVSMTGEGGTFADGAGNALTLTVARGDGSYDFQIVTAADAGGRGLTLELATMAVKVSVGTPSTATLTIDEPPNSPPTFDETGPAERSVPENSPAGTAVGGAFGATDADGDALAYSLTGQGSDNFAVDADGQITVAADGSIDFEGAPSYTLTLGVKDNKDAAGNTDATEGDDDTIAVTITVTNLNEAPVFNETGPAERSVPENSPAGTNVGTPFTATDPDDGDMLVYSLTGVGSNKFAVDASGQISVAADAVLDFEDKASYTLTLGVKDDKDADGNGEDTEADDDTIAVTITVTNVNESPIFYETGPAERSVPENSTADTTVGAPFSATDPEGDSLVYSLTGTGSGKFAVDANGQITVVADNSLDYEGTPNTYTVTLTVNDGMAAATILVNLTVTDVNEPLAFADDVAASIEVAENLPAGINVGGRFTATDPEGDPLKYSLTGAGSDKFVVDTSGQVSVAADAVLDFEETPSYTLTLGVKDNKDAAGNAAPTEAYDDTIVVTISLTDVPSPPAPESPSFSAGPTDPASERVVRWTALVLPISGAVTDYDVQYRVVGAAQWTVHPFEGTELSTTITGLGSNTEHEVQVRAVNVEGPGPWSIPARSMTAKAQLTVAFGELNYTVTEGETATITVTVTPAADREVTVTITSDGAVFADGTEDTLTLTIARGEDSRSFEIVTNADAGGSELTLELATMAVKVSVGTPGTATVTIDEPPNGPPAFDETGPAERSVPENSSAGTAVGEAFGATDADDGDMLTYSLAGPDSDKFVMDANGQITVGADVDLDFEAGVNSYTVTAQVTDSQGAAGDEDATIDDTIAVTIKVTDVAGPAPVDNGSIVVEATGVASLKVTWGEVFDATTYQVWRLECGPEDLADDSGACTVGPIVESESAANSHIAAGLKPATRYQFTIRGVNGEGDGDWTHRVSGTTLAVAAPTGLEATPLHQSIILIWDNPDDAGIFGYQFRLKPDERADWPAWQDFCHSDALTTVQVLPDLSNGNEYAVQIRALNAEGEGAASIETQATPGEAALPARPTGLIATPGDRSITLTWSDANDPSITGYQLRINRSEDEDWRPWQNINGGGPSTTSHLLLDLANGSEYAVQLRVLNALGESVPSVEAVVTPGEAAPPRALAILATRVGDGSVTITWSDPGDPNVTGYQVRRRMVGEGSWRRWKDLPNSGVSTTSHMVRNLTNDRAYLLQIRAVSPWGEGVPSNEVRVTPSAPAQSPRTIYVDATAIDAVATISDRVTMIY